MNDEEFLTLFRDGHRREVDPFETANPLGPRPPRHEGRRDDRRTRRRRLPAPGSFAPSHRQGREPMRGLNFP